MKFLIVVNPISGGKDKKTFLSEVERLSRKYDFDIQYFNTTGENDQKNLRRRVDELQPDKVVSVGGDGTTLMTSLALHGTDIPFGIIPLGSANGMAKELSVPIDPVLAFYDILLSNMTVPLDIIQVNKDHYSIHLGDVGINSTIVENYTRERARGWLSYAKYFFSAVENASEFKVIVETEGKTYEHMAYSLIIANTRMYGTGAIINPIGNPHDGKFEIVIVVKHEWSGIVNLGLSAFDESIVSELDDYLEIHQVKKAKIILEEPKMLQLDGELIGKNKEIEVEIIPSCVQFITTSDNKFIGQLRK